MNLYLKIFFYAIFYAGTLNADAQSRVQALTATQHNQNIIINYLISAGNTCSGYQILKSNDSLNFNVIYDYSGICGESSKAQNITFSDEYPEKNKKNYYKVLILPSDYSAAISVFFIDFSEKGYLLLQNPITDYLSILSGTNSNVLKIYNQKGDLIQSLTPNEQGLYQKDISSLGSGIYYFVIESSKGNPLHGKFIKE